MDTMSEIYTLIETAENAVHEQRFELAQALAAIATARAMADIANALRDDKGNSVAHILHNMSYNLDVIAQCVASAEAASEQARIWGG
jgi:hypothetical protein